jgi:virginiamycin B lyase
MRESNCNQVEGSRKPSIPTNHRHGAGVARRLPFFIVAAPVCCALFGWGQTPAPLPDGTGKETIQKACGSCHALTTVTNAGHNRQEWTSVLNMMVTAGAPVPKDQIATVTDYLAKNFPERPAPEAVVIPGSVEVSIKEWQVPTAGSRPHDPAFAPDGSVWYTGQMANVLGRFDPKTQQFKEYPLKTPGSGPHGLVPDKDGNIWFTANFKAYIGKLDPKTGNVTEYPMSDPQAKDPHTAVAISRRTQTRDFMDKPSWLHRRTRTPSV